MGEERQGGERKKKGSVEMVRQSGPERVEEKDEGWGVSNRDGG